MRAELKKAKTVDQVNTAIAAEAKRITGRNIDVDLAGSDLQVAKEHGEGVLRGFEKFPTARINHIQSYEPHTQPGQETSFAFNRGRTGESYHPASGTRHIGDTIFFNNAYAANPAHYYATVADSKKSGWLTTGGPIGTASHEFGHSVGRYSRAEPFVEARATQIAHSHGQQPGEYVTRHLSEYAASNRYELTSEAFADVMNNGAKASPLSRELFGVLHQWHTDNVYDTP